MKQDQFTWNWYPWLLDNHSQWTILEPLYYSSFLFATLVYGVIGINFVDHSLNQGALAEHKSAETPIGHESYHFSTGLLKKVYFICSIDSLILMVYWIGITVSQYSSFKLPKLSNLSGLECIKNINNEYSFSFLFLLKVVDSVIFPILEDTQ